MDKAYFNSMEKLTSNMEKLTGSISDGFALLQRMMCQPLNNMNMNPQFMMPSHHLQMYPRAQTSAQSTESRSHHNGQYSFHINKLFIQIMTQHFSWLIRGVLVVYCFHILVDDNSSL